MGYEDFAKLHKDASGHFDVILSPTRPAGYGGDWWQLDPKTSFLMIRQVSADWTTERDPTISIERTDISVERPRPSAIDWSSDSGMCRAVLSTSRPSSSI